MPQKKKNRLLKIEDIIAILFSEKLIYKAEVTDVGQDTDYDRLDFSFNEWENKLNFTFYLDETIHNSNIELHKDGWFYKIYTKEDFLNLISQ